jgi:perosamine synthetase
VPGVYDAINIGFNYRMSEIHASIGLKQMEKLKKFLNIRKRNFIYLKKQFYKNKNIYVLDSVSKDSISSYYCMNIILSKKLSKKRTEIINYLNSKGIGTSIYYPQPVPRMSYYKNKYGYDKNNFENASIISDRSISLPVGPHLSLKNLRYMAKNLLLYLEKIDV